MEKTLYIPNSEFREPDAVNRITKVLLNNPCISIGESISGLNSCTVLDKDTPLLLGFGVGGRELSRGLPIDSLSMILTAEQLKSNLGLGKITLLLADKSAELNIDKGKEFTKDNIERVTREYKNTIGTILKNLNLSHDFQIVLESELNTHSNPFFATERPEEKYFSMEAEIIYSLVSQEKGGIKIGWFKRHTTERDKTPVIDEIAFDNFYKKKCKESLLEDKASFVYVKAKTNLIEDKNGEVIKESPYLTYDPESVILLDPLEDVSSKLKPIFESKNKVSFSAKKQYERLCRLFEKVVLKDQKLQGNLTNKLQNILLVCFSNNL